MASNFAYGQDWCDWSFRFKFKLNTETIRYEYKNIEVFLNDSYTYENFRDYELMFDSETQEYSLFLLYGCISCGFPNSDRPPEIYLKINLEYFRGVTFSTIIPVYFQKSKSFRDLIEGSAIDLGTIDIRYFLTDNFWKDNIETFEIIDVTSTNSIHYRKSGEYLPRRMNRLIKVEMKK